MRFRVVHHDTSSENKYDANDVFEYLCDKEAAWRLWHSLTRLKCKHVYIYNLSGTLQTPEKGIDSLVDCLP